MSNLDILELCFRNLLRRRMRTFLAVSGVVIGTFAIVVMLSIGFGLEDGFQRQIEGWGNLRMIEVFPGGRGGPQMPGDERGIINDRAIEAMENMPGVVAVTPVVTEWSMTLRIGREIANVSILGVRPEVLERFNYEVTEGRLIHETDRNVILFGSQVPYFFWDPNSPVWSDTATNVMTDRIIMSGDPNFGRRSGGSGGGSGQDGDFQEYRVRGIGVLAVTNSQTDWQAFMKIDEVERIQEDLRRARGETIFRGATRTYDRAIVYVETINDSARISSQLRDLDFWTHSPADWLESMRETARMIQGVLGGIGAISLLVAALGITNTMIMSIYERTKEIGVMKVVGANLKDIRKMFLLEAGLIGFIGGAMGLVLSYTLSFLMNTVLSEAIGMALGGVFWGAGAGSISIIPWWVAVSALGFATTIGMVAGFYPAKRAMNLSALESLRNE